MYTVCSQRLLNFKETVSLLTEEPFYITFNDEIQAWLGEIVTTPEDTRMVTFLLETLRDELKELTGRPTPIVIYVNARVFRNEGDPEFQLEDLLIAFEGGPEEEVMEEKEDIHPTFPVMVMNDDERIPVSSEALLYEPSGNSLEEEEESD